MEGEFAHVIDHIKSIIFYYYSTLYQFNSSMSNRAIISAVLYRECFMSSHETKLCFSILR